MIEILKKALPPTQKEAAALLHLSQPAIHKWLTGKGQPSPMTAVVIERATNGAVTRYELRPDVFGPAPAPTDQAEDRAA